jgi:hypothetical protein
MDVDAIDQLLIRYSAFVKWWTNNDNGTVQQLFTHFKNGYDSGHKYSTNSVCGLLGCNTV